MVKVVQKEKEAKVEKKPKAKGRGGTVTKKVTPAMEPSRKEIPFDDRIITCEICLDILHNATNIAPCNHKFCAGCIYEWYVQSHTCPKCRGNAIDMTRDPMAVSVVEFFLANNPAVLDELDDRELKHLKEYNEWLQTDNAARWFGRVVETEHDASWTEDITNDSDEMRDLRLDSDDDDDIDEGDDDDIDEEDEDDDNENEEIDVDMDLYSDGFTVFEMETRADEEMRQRIVSTAARIAQIEQDRTARQLPRRSRRIRQ